MQCRLLNVIINEIRLKIFIAQHITIYFIFSYSLFAINLPE